MSYLRFECKRAFGNMKPLLITICLLALICGSLSFALIQGNTKEETTVAAPYTVAIVLPQNAGLHYNMAVSVVGQMESLQGLCNIVQVKDEKIARNMLKTGEAAAAVLIPEGMIHSIRDGSNLPATIIYPHAASRESALFSSVVSALSRMLANSQAGVYSLYDIYASQNVSDSIQTQANTELNNIYINYVLDRGSLFYETGVDFDETIPTWLGFVCGSLALLLLLTGICLCDFFLPKADVLADALHRLRISRSRQNLSQVLAAALAQLCVFAPLFLLFGIINGQIRILPSFGFYWLPSLCVILLFTCSLTLFITRVCKVRESAILVLFFVSLLLVFLAGGLLPMAFLPDFLRKVNNGNPVFWLSSVLKSAFLGSIDFSALLILLLWSLALIELPALFERLRSERIPSADRDLSAGRKPSHVSVKKAPKSRFFAWILLLFKRSLYRPISWFLLILILGLGVIAGIARNSYGAISVALYCENPDELTAKMLDALCENKTDSLYHFYLTDTREGLEDAVVWNSAECGFVIPDHLEELLKANAGEPVIETVVSSSTLFSELILEDVFSSLMDFYAPVMLYDYIKENEVTALSDNELQTAVDEYFDYWINSGTTFHVEYEEIPEDFFDTQNAFLLPVRELLSLLLLTAVFSGIGQYRHDRKKGQILVRFPGENTYLPLLYALIPYMICSVFGFITLYIAGLQGAPALDLAKFFSYGILLTALAFVLHKLIKQDLLFDALIPFLILLCVLYAPIIMDFSGFLPGGKVLQYFAPASWFLNLL